MLLLSDLISLYCIVGVFRCLNCSCNYTKNTYACIQLMETNNQIENDLYDVMETVLFKLAVSIILYVFVILCIYVTYNLCNQALCVMTEHFSHFAKCLNSLAILRST